MSFLDLTKSRRSIRAFEAHGVVTDAQMSEILEAAQSAPSGGNCQPWHFYVIRSREIVAQMLEKSCHQPFLAQASAVIVVCAEPSRSDKYGERGRGLYCLQDTAAAVQNILLCAKSLGLGTCWCGSFDETALAQVIGMPEGRRPVAIVPVGVAAQEPEARGRRAIEEIATFL